MELKKGYKQTEVGVIPKDWELQKLESICSPSKSRINPRQSNQNYKCIELEHLSQETGILLGYVDSVHQLSQKSLFTFGDVLFGKLRPYLKKFLFADFEGVCSTEIWVLRARQIAINKYIYYLIQTNSFLETANQSTGTKMPRAEWSVVGNLQIPLPLTKAEQTAIATVLSDADALIQSLEKLIAKKRNIKQGAMQELLKPKEGWEVKKLGEIAFFTNGKAHEQFIDDAGDYIVVNSKFISTEGEVFKNASISLCPLNIGDITMVMSDIPNGKALAKCFVIPKSGKYTLNQRICALRTETLDTIFLACVINRNKYFLAFDSGTGQTNLKKQDVLECPINLPPTKKEQTRIATILADMDSEISALETKLAKYKQLKQGMMQNLLTGKIRLV